MPGFLLDRAARGSIGPRRLADARLAVASLLLIIFELALSPLAAAQDLRAPSTDVQIAWGLRDLLIDDA